jgi:predicted PurR-regulated permease PerM
MPDDHPVEDVPPPVADPKPEPPSRSTATLWGVIHSASPASAGLFLLAAIYTLYFARSFLLPIVLAGMLALLLEPLVRGLRRRLRIPLPLGAGLVLVASLGGLGFGVYELAQPAYDWVEKAPQSLKKIERRLREVKKPVQTLGKATEQVEKITQVGSTPTDSRTIAVKPPSLGKRIADRATAV